MGDGGGDPADAAFERFFRASATPSCILDGTGRVLAANPAAARLLGRSETALTGRAYAAMLAPEEAARAHPAGASGLPGYCQGVHRIALPEGGTRRLCGSATAEGEGPGRLVHMRLAPADRPSHDPPGDPPDNPPDDPTVDPVVDLAQDATRRAALVERATGIGTWDLTRSGGATTFRCSAVCAVLHGLDAGATEAGPSLEALLARYPAATRRRVETAIEALEAGGAPVALDATLEPSDPEPDREEPRTLRLTLVSDRIPEGPLRILGTVEDVTAARRREGRLSRLTAVAENTANGVFAVDRDRRIIWVNRAFTEMTGYAPEEALGRLPPEVLHSELTDAADAAEIVASIRRGQPIGKTMLHRSKDGRDYWVWAEVLPLADSAGQTVGFLSVMTDVTAQRSAERRLIEAEREARQARERLLAALEAMPDGFVIYDSDERLVVCNSTFRNALAGFGAHCVPGARFEDLLRGAVSHGLFPEATGCEQAWISARLEAFRRPLSVTETTLADGRRLRSVDKAMPDGGRVGLWIDITEFRHTEERLRTAEKAAKTAHDRLLIAIEALPHGFVIFDENEELVIWNSRYRGVLGPCEHMAVPGTRLEDLVEACIASGVYPDVLDDADGFRAARMAAHRNADTPQEQRIYDGRWLRIVDVAVPGGGRVGLRIDITRQKETEQRLRDAERKAREANERLTGAIEALQDGFVLFDRDRRLVVCNGPYRALVPGNPGIAQPGCTLEQLLRHGIAMGAFPDALGREEAFLAERIALFDRPLSDSEMQLSDGRWIRSVDKAIPSGGKVGLRIDITNSKRTEERLRAAERGARAARSQLISAVEALPDAFALYDAEDRLVLCNERYRQFYARTAPVLVPGVGFEEMLRYGLARGQYPEAEGREESWLAERLVAHRRADAEVVQNLEGDRWVRIVEKSTPDGGRVGLRIDITELKRQQEALEIARERAEAANRAKSRFLANMSHEIRTPMNGVMAMAELLHGAVVEPEHRAMVGVIRESAEALLTILNDILDFSKIEADRLELEAEPFLPADIARKVESLHALKAAEKGIGFRVATEGAVDRPLVGDAHRILQVLHNLVSNAIKFTEAGAVAITVARRANGALALTIADTGIGMTEAQRTRLFEPFVQADSSTTRRFGGTGLGMAIVKRLVDLMQGRLDIDSSPGEGTRVSIVLPLAAADDAPAGPTPAGVEGRAPEVGQPVAGAALPAGLRVLAADDNRTNRTVLAALLRRLRVEAEIVETGADAVAAVASASRPFDLLLLDIAMPGMDGIETLEAVRAHEAAQGVPPVPALAVTANALTHQVESYLARGFDGHIAKPIRTATLVAGIRDHVRARPRA